MSVLKQLLLLAMVAAVVLGGWLADVPALLSQERAGEDEAAMARGTAPAPVGVERVRFASDAAVIKAVGSGRASQSIELHPEAAGRVTEILFAAGDRVTEGQPLLRLDAEAEELAVELAQVRIENAEQQLARYERAAPSGAVSSSEVDRARTDLEAARIELAQAELALRYRTLRAPFAGVVGIPEVDRGDRITESTVIAPLDDRTPLFVDFEVPEAFSYGVREGGELTLTTWARPGDAFTGEVTAMGSRIDPLRRTLQVRATVANEADLLRPGMGFSIRMPLAGERFPSVPSIAVQWDRDGAYVWRVKADNTVEKVMVSVLKRTEGWVLLDGPLEAEARVVVEGLQRMRPGRAVEIIDSEQVAALEPAR